MEDEPLTGGDVVKVVVFILLVLPPTLLGVGVVPTIFLSGGYYLMRKNGNFEYFASGISATRIYLTIAIFAGSVTFVYAAYPYLWGVGHELSNVRELHSPLRMAKERAERNAREHRPGDILYGIVTTREPNEDREQRLLLEERIEEIESVMEKSLAGKLGFDREADLYWDETWISGDLVLPSIIWVGGCALYLLLLQSLLATPMRSHQNWVAMHGAFAGKVTGKREGIVKTKGFNVVKGGRLKNYSVADELLKWAALKEAGHITEEEFQAARARLIEEG